MRYGLEGKTVFNTRVNKVYKDKDSGRWIVNDPKYGHFDGVVAAIGTCGPPKKPYVDGEEHFNGHVFHSSELDGKEVRDKTVFVVGGGASAVEALEFAIAQQAAKVYILARSEKWIIPR
jgi:cation diffusion facilitator CzcD-associated flavoprotein CzcO